MIGLAVRRARILFRFQRGLSRLSTFARRAPQRISYEYEERNGYTVGRTRRIVFVAWDGDELIVLSPVCTHLACNVTFNTATNLFECPCHGGTYDPAGRVVEGPPPRPLRRFQTRDRDGIMEIQVT